MFEQAIRASAALSEAMQHNRGSLVPALCGCPKCQSAWMISAAVLGTCTICGAEIASVDVETYSPGQMQRVRLDRAGNTSIAPSTADGHCFGGKMNAHGETGSYALVHEHARDHPRLSR
jgi:hypothetical protein